MSSEKIVLAHWGEICNGGGERVAWELARGFDEPLHVGHRDPSIEPSDVEVRELFDGRMRDLLAGGGLSQMAATQIAWELPDTLHGAETLLTSGNEPLVYVPRDGQAWVHYVHHTSRHATDLLKRGLSKHTGPFKRIKRPLEQLVRKAERTLYANYATKPDLLVANSETVAKRIQRYWGIDKADIRVVYPPVPVDDFGAHQAATDDYYLSLCRLDTHKGLDQLVRAFNELDTDATLKVAGTGSEGDRLRQIAGGNVEFLGYVPEDEKAALMAGAKAFCVNAHAEDFGMTTVEALASGTPVIGVEEGMTQHLLLDGRSGITYTRDEGELRAAIQRFERNGVAWSARKIERFADRFSPERFHAEMREVVAEARERARVTVEWDGVEQHRTEPEVARADGGQR